jgi:hypothetical protein
MPAQLPLCGDHLGTAELRNLLIAKAFLPAAAPGPGIDAAEWFTGGECAEDRVLTHLLNAACDDEIRRPAHHRLGGEVDRLLRRAALTVDRDTGD